MSVLNGSTLPTETNVPSSRARRSSQDRTRQPQGRAASLTRSYDYHPGETKGDATYNSSLYGADQRSSTDRTGQRQPRRQKTQKDQDEDDDKERQEAQEKLVQSWMDRLQLISVITTFFAANEAQLLSITTPDSPDDASVTQQIANATLAGALVLHSFSAVISFLGAFVLVRYKLKEAKKADEEEEGKAGEKTSQTSNRLWTSNPHLEQVGLFMSNRPPSEVLYQTHSLAVASAFVGFLFGVIGICCYVWSQQPRAVAIFTSATLGACGVGTILVIKPFARAEKRLSRQKTPHQ